ncbi:hypothetical protein BX265_8234 [Streptomyces sp. TLI_235]|nr:hypothetical protein [Streptomyces sp. TLI_235]PBC67616.1 hypothetical protein BX265_8234 [Streptomyces sp. TLI_235]
MNWWHTVFFASSGRGGQAYATVRYDAQGGSSSLSPVSNNGTSNSEGRAVHVHHDGTGRYRVVIDGASFSRGTGHVQVTPYGTGSPARCNPQQTTPAGNGLQITVACWSISTAATPQPADTPWLLSYADQVGLHGDPQVPAAYAATSGDPANPVVDAAHSYSSHGEQPTVARLGTGWYRLTWNSGGSYGGNVQVGSTSGSGSYCHLGNIGDYRVPPLVAIDVYCDTPAGQPGNSEFTVAYVRRP